MTGQRNISFDIELAGQPMGKVQAAVAALPSIRNMPAGVAMAPIGDAEAMKELFASFGLAMFTGVLCIYIVLVLLFKDFMQPATILVALVLSIPGAFLALFLTRTAISSALDDRPDHADGRSRPRTPCCWWNTRSSHVASAA